MSRLTPEGRPVLPATGLERRCWSCQKCREDSSGGGDRRCELRQALAGSDSGEGRIWTDRACQHFSRHRFAVIFFGERKLAEKI